MNVQPPLIKVQRRIIVPSPLEGHRFPVQALAFTADGAILTSAACNLQDLQVVEETVWDAKTGKPTTKRTASPGAVLALAFAPGGRTLAVAVQERTPVLWDVAAWRERWLEGHRSSGYALVVADDGGQLATADFANDITLWDVTGGRSEARCKGHTERVVSLAFTPGGAVLASGGLDNPVRLWVVARGGEQRGLLEEHASPVQAVPFSPDGRTLASGDRLGVVTLWDVATLTARVTRSEALGPPGPHRTRLGLA
jgi:WD40 repeat protein